MEFTKNMIWSLAVALVLLACVLSAPVKQPAQKEFSNQHVREILAPQKPDSTVQELEDLSVHAVPAVAEVAKPSFEDTQQLQTEQDQPELQKMLNSPSANRQYAIPDANVFSGAQDLPALSPETDDSLLYDGEPEVDLSPKAVAQYLLQTNDFDGFDQALADLINTGVLSPDEVLQYKDTVGLEYESLVNDMTNDEARYIQELSRSQPMDYMNIPQLPQQPARAANYPEYTMSQNFVQGPGFGYAETIRRTDLQRMLLAKQDTLDSIMDVVLGEYYAKPEDVIQPEYYQPENPSYQLADDADLDQLMEYLQGSLKEQDGDGSELAPVEDNALSQDTAEVKSQDVPWPVEDKAADVPVEDKVADELAALPKQEAEVEDKVEEVVHSGEGDEGSNDTKSESS